MLYVGDYFTLSIKTFYMLKMRIWALCKPKGPSLVRLSEEMKALPKGGDATWVVIWKVRDWDLLGGE